MGEVNGARGVWGYVRGGMGALAGALAAAARAAGAEVRTGGRVAGIRVRDGRADGVVLADGAEIPARRVASSIDARRTLLGLVGREHLSPDVAEAVGAIDFSSASLKINLALTGLPRFLAASHAATSPARTTAAPSTSAPTLDHLERAFADAVAGRPSEEPILECTLPSAVDPTVAPAGRQLMSMFVQYAPYRLAEGAWDDGRSRSGSPTAASRCSTGTRRASPPRCSTVRCSRRSISSAASGSPAATSSRAP